MGFGIFDAADETTVSTGKETAMKVIIFRLPRFLAKILIRLQV